MNEEGSGIRSLEPQQVKSCLNKGLFDKTTAQFIEPWQVKEIDFITIDCEKAGGQTVFSTIFSNANNLQELDKQNFYHLVSYINSTNLVSLKSTQIQFLDFKDERVAKKEILDGLAKIGNWYLNKEGDGIQQLSFNQIQDCLDKNLFDVNTAAFIPAPFLSQLNLSKVTSSDVRKHLEERQARVK